MKRVRFIKRARNRLGASEWRLAYEEGTVADLNDDSAEHWIRRGVAVEVEATQRVPGGKQEAESAARPIGPMGPISPIESLIEPDSDIEQPEALEPKARRARKTGGKP